MCLRGLLFFGDPGDGLWLPSGRMRANVCRLSVADMYDIRVRRRPGKSGYLQPGEV